MLSWLLYVLQFCIVVVRSYQKGKKKRPFERLLRFFVEQLLFSLRSDLTGTVQSTVSTSGCRASARLSAPTSYACTAATCDFASKLCLRRACCPSVKRGLGTSFREKGKEESENSGFNDGTTCKEWAGNPDVDVSPFAFYTTRLAGFSMA